MKQAKDLEALEALKTELEALKTEHKTLKTEHEALGIKQAKDLQALKTEHAVLQRCFEVKEVDGGGSTKLHVKDECELNVHGGHTTHGHHTIKGGNLFVSNGLGSSECSSDDGDSDDTAIKCSGKGNIVVGHQHDELEAGHKAITGSHNIVLGKGHTVTSHGGIVSGVDHVTSGPHASAIAGSSNTVSGAGAIALGGDHGTHCFRRGLFCFRWIS